MLLRYGEPRPGIIPRKDYLTLLGLDTGEGIDITYGTGSGPLTVHHSFVPLAGVAGYEADAGAAPFVWYSVDETASLGIFTLTECHNNDTYSQAVDSFFAEVAAKGIGTVAIDLRYNGGGDSRVIRTFLQYVDVDSYSVFERNGQSGRQ